MIQRWHASTSRRAILSFCLDRYFALAAERGLYLFKKHIQKMEYFATLRCCAASQLSVHRLALYDLQRGRWLQLQMFLRLILINAILGAIRPMSA